MNNGFFSGRNGSDALSVFLTALALVTATAASVITDEVIRTTVTLVALVFIAFAVWRMLSRNIAKRRVENEKFLSFFRAFRKDPQKAAEKKQKKEDRKTHVYYKCPECKKELRVPRGKGKIRITCPHCGHQFIKKT